MKSTFAKLHGMFAVVVANSLIFMTGCAPMPPKSGFLSDYSELQLLEKNAMRNVHKSGGARSRSTMRVWANRANLDELAAYEGLIVDNFVIRLGKHSAGNWISPEKLNELAKALHAEFVKSVSRCCTIVDEPGKGVAHFRTALTDISPMFVYESAQGIGALTWANSRAGTGALELEMVDSVTKKQIAAIVAKGEAGRFDTLDSGKDRWDAVREGIRDFGAFLCDRRRAAGASN